MVRIIYRRPRSTRPPRYRGRGIDTIHGLLNRLLEDVLQGPTRIGRPVSTCRRCGRLSGQSLLPEGLCEECFNLTGPGRLRGSTIPCAKCGIRFSPNLLEQGLCRNCRSTDEDESNRERRQTFGVGSNLSNSALRKAYEVLGCNESASDEVIKTRYREMAKDCHSDRLPPGPSTEVIRKANEQFHRLQEAYEKIMNSRKKPK